MQDKKEVTNPWKMIRAKCLDCCCFSPKEVDLCTAIECPIHAARHGRNPYRKPRSEKQIAAAQLNILKAREAKENQNVNA